MNFGLARQKHDVWIAAVPEPCSTTALVELNCLPNFNNSKVWFRRRASAVLLSNLIPEFSSARQKHDVWTGPKWDQNMQFTLAKKNDWYALAFSFGSLLPGGCLRGMGGGVSLVASYLVCDEKMKGLWRVLLHPPRPGCFWIRAVPLTALLT